MPAQKTDDTSFAEQLVNRIVNPLGLVLLTRERIQEILDDAATRGRITRSDANALVAELVKRGRQQVNDLLKDVAPTKRTVAVGGTLPVAGYDELTAGQVTSRLKSLTPAELRRVREYERRHANRKSVLAAIEKSLA